MFRRLRKISRNLLIVLNVIASLLFLAGCYAYLFPPDKYWFIGLLAIGALYLLLIQLMFLGMWLFIKPRMCFIGILTLALAWKPIQHLFQFRLPAKFEMSKVPGQFRVMNWNVEHFEIGKQKNGGVEKQMMLQLIRKYQPDIAFFQEMVGSETNPGAINYIPFFRDTLGFADYHFTYNNKLDYDDDHHFGIILFSRFPILNKKEISYNPNDYNSTFQYADILVGNDTIRLFNLHLQSLKLDKANRHYLQQPGITGEENIRNSKSIIAKLKRGFERRARQSERIRQAIEASPYPVIVCGDFNDVPNSYAYHTIGKSLNNAFAAKGSGIGRTYAGISPTLRIDHVFAGNQFHIRQYTRIKKELSDHFPVVADLEIKKQ
ncbi:MAG TPA: endonuclease/exonuclease/phosphatase family protein [Ferruginibacter sp.]|nr:endonuclease/exonuclease/phosphatase family protein [Ferruginibacter sp.]HRO17721.1 endonuclease/exonuclease/phosphatase family protein [Ferruginibacter sp.]HRQ20114.1 endonuclease/exonuclease/phosphatase family protein [Ferruginibacter sp.]